MRSLPFLQGIAEAPSDRISKAVRWAFVATAVASTVFAVELPHARSDVFSPTVWAGWFALTAIACLAFALRPMNASILAIATASALVGFWSRAIALAYSWAFDDLRDRLPLPSILIGVAAWTLMGVLIATIGLGGSAIISRERSVR